MAGTLAAIFYHDRHREDKRLKQKMAHRNIGAWVPGDCGATDTILDSGLWTFFCFLICKVRSNTISKRCTQVPCSGSRPMREGLRPKRMLKDLPTEGVVLG